MIIELPYGEGILSLELAADRVKGTLEAKPFPRCEEEDRLVREALARPIDSAPLREIVRRGERVCIVIGDMTRSWVRHHILLPPILDELEKGGIADDEIVILSATGDHRQQTDEERQMLAGPGIYRRCKVIDHRARAAKENIFLGTTAYGTPVSLNRQVVEADRVILTGGIVYHFLAGWGGGKKAIVPGVASCETIMKNHSLAFNPAAGGGLNPAVRAGMMEGNPCSDDMVQGASLVKPDFLVNAVINDQEHRIAYVVAGNYLTAFRKGCDLVDEHCRVMIGERAELVIASCGGYPKDIDFYQTYKTIYNAHFALEKGGTLLLASESREGMGNADYTSVFTAFDNNRERETALREKYTIGGHMGYHAALLAEENDILVFSGLPEGQVRQMGMIPVAGLEEAMVFIKEKHGAIPPAWVLPYGGTTMPQPDG